MSRYQPKSLIQHFAAPPDYTGTFGWLCGYSADASFLDAAAERFTGQTAAQRSWAGKVTLVALLDRGQPQVLPHDAPGVLHAAMRDPSGFSLLHAKVALLGYRHEHEPERWIVRLLVCTGNWTRETVERSLDGMWSADLCSDEVSSRDTNHLQVRADVAAAWNLFQWLKPRFDLDAFQAEPHSLTALAHAQFDGWLGRVRKPANVKPRFFDSRNQSLLAQLPALVEHHAGRLERNTLALGSGFYEGGSGKGAPRVLVQIVETLKNAGLATRSCAVDVFVEPTACQAVAERLPAMSALRWRVWSAEPPPFLEQQPRRTLHAKFIFGSGYRSGSDKCLNGWAYLGSGNLTTPGFLQRCPLGNLEAGVVLGDDSLTWSGPGLEGCVSSRLPLQWEREITDATQLQAGADMPERPAAFLAAPVSWCRYLPALADRPARMVLPAHDLHVEVLDTTDQVCPAVGPLEVAWLGPPQPSVVVRWYVDGRPLRCTIPVIDEAGRVAAVELPKLDIESAWWQLAQFPQPPAEEDSDAEKRDFEAGKALPGTVVPNPVDSAIRTMMRLVENIAERQARLTPADWEPWCISLEQALRQAADCTVVLTFSQRLALNPLAVLRNTCSLPAFARDLASTARVRYLQVLEAVERCWGVGGFDSTARSQEDVL